MKLFFATHNLDKKKEIAYILKSKFEVLYIDDFEDYPDVVETGSSTAENALLKAESGMNYTGLSSFADDTALEVDALDGKPGIYTARFAGENASYRDNYIKLLSELEHIPLERRTARFRTAIALILKDREPQIFEGICEGRIVLEPEGENGFGYDPVFRPLGYEDTFASMDPELKNKISHRARAVKHFTDYLNSIDGA